MLLLQFFIIVVTLEFKELNLKSYNEEIIINKKINFKTKTI